jgi:hypothetical protein
MFSAKAETGAYQALLYPPLYQTNVPESQKIVPDFS